MSKIFIIGGPGCGKNTIAEHVARKLKIPHVNYRSAIKELLRGSCELSDKIRELDTDNQVFPVSLAFEVIKQYCDRHEIDDFVMDGYPKSKEEAYELSRLVNSNDGNLTFLIDTPEEIAANRLKNRLVCPECQYTVYDTNPDTILEIQCATCHLPLISRSDDTDDGIRDRLKRFYSEKEAMVNELSKISEITIVDGSKGLAFIISDIAEKIFGKGSDILAERGARIMMEHLGLNLADPNYIGTAGRIVKSLKELMRGSGKNASVTIKENLSTVFPTHYRGMIILEPIKCSSLCSHHLLPVDYEVIFGYIPEDKSIGFSKVVKVIGLIAAKPSLQEDFTQEIIDTFDKVLAPKGIIVIVRGKHSCMMIRGEKTENINTTSAVRGVFKDNIETRQEFLSLIGKK